MAIPRNINCDLDIFDFMDMLTFMPFVVDDKTKTPTIRNVIFANPATVVFWTDGTKTVVKCGERDAYDPEKGLAMAIAKKAMGNKGSYFDVFKKWVKYEEKSGGCGPDYCEI